MKKIFLFCIFIFIILNYFGYLTHLKQYGYVDFSWRKPKKEVDGTYVPNVVRILLNQDWCYPDCGNNVESSFKFNSDGTFNFSTIMFGGMSRFGTWTDVGNGIVQTNDNKVGTQNIKIISKNRIKVGSTTYKNR
jgi:hypothetical protein